MLRSLGAVGLLVLLGACHPNPFEILGERELRPPRQGVTLGSLYYVREAPTPDLRSPANLEQLCTVDLAAYGVGSPAWNSIADIDLLSKYDASGSLDGIKTEMFSLGLTAGLNNYFEYKLTNAQRAEIDYQAAENIYQATAFRSRCRTWRGNIAGQNWGKYQIRSVTRGTLKYSRSSGFNVGGEVSAKLRLIEPKLKAELKRTAQQGLTGDAMVVSFAPLLRN